MISFEDFKKIELKIGKVICAEKMEKSNKLIKLEIDLGNEKRQIIAGIGKEYSPENLKNKFVVVVTNLESKKIMGTESHGMILAAEDVVGNPILLMPEKEVEPGTAIK